MGSFSLKPGSVEKLTKQIIAKSDIINNALESKMNAVVDIVYKTARARRPKITPAEHKLQGRKKGAYRVSDPNAKLGVPVNTGALQASIEKEVIRDGDKHVGTISAGGNLQYAAMIEFGTSKMAPRPFMRPAINENKELIRRIFKQPIEKL